MLLVEANNPGQGDQFLEYNSVKLSKPATIRLFTDYLKPRQGTPLHAGEKFRIEREMQND
jgi:hypothetical protein